MPNVFIPDLTFHGASGDVSTLAALPWWLQDAGHAEATALATGEEVKVAVIDSGFDPIWKNRDEWRDAFVGVAPVDDNGHGTHVAGIIRRVAPACKLLVFKVFDRYGGGSTSRVAEAWRQAIFNGARVINFSGGTDVHDDELAAVCAEADSKGIINIVASGNAGPKRISFPAADPNTTSVAAHDQQLRVAPFSSPSDVDCAAAGVQIDSLWLGGGMAKLSGTSMASPMIAGAAALYVDHARRLGAEVRGGDFLRDLAASATDIEEPGKDVRTGAGAIHFARLLTRLSERTAKPPTTEKPWRVDHPIGRVGDREYAFVSREAVA